jgi:type IX secretion system PorP/SprF family membrane protein
MRGYWRYGFLGFFLLFAISLVNSQDVHYSQMHATPLYINPALAGNHDCDYRAGVNYRQQAASFTIPYTTYTAWGDTRFFPKFTNRRGWFGLGAHLYYDNAGNGDLKKVQGMLFGSYSQGFNEDNSLYGSLGVGIGYTNRSVNYDKLLFGRQWNGYEFDPSMDSGESYKGSSIFYPDFNIGLMVHQLVDENWMYEVGVSLSHVNKPNDTFYDDAPNKLGYKYIGHASLQRIISERLLIKPEVYYIGHEGAEEILLGANVVYNVIELNLHGGLWYRVGRDIVPMLGIEYNKLTILFSYDINVSTQRAASAYKGGFELSLVKRFCSRMSTKRKPCKMLEF